MLERLFAGGKVEQKVTENIRKHMMTLCSSCETFKEALEKQDIELMLSVADLEREGDSIRREIISNIYEGAFLPFLRPNICRLAEIVDEAYDVLEDAALEFEYVNPKLDSETREDCIKIANLNIYITEMLLIAFEALFAGGDLREKTLAVRIFEKKVDEIKFDVIKRLRKREIKDFWEGKSLSDFVSSLTHVSDIVEDASDYLHIINVKLR